MKCATCFALTSIPTPKSSTPGLLLMIVRLRVPRACSARIRFSGRPQRPKPPHMIDAPSGICATASSALANTLCMSVIILHQLRAPFRGRREDRLNGIAAPQIAAQLRQALDETVERVLDRIGVGEADERSEERRVGKECRSRW